MASDPNFVSQTERGNLSYTRVKSQAVSTTESPLIFMDSAAFGGHSMSVTIKNTGGTTIRIRVYVSNDKGEDAGWLTLANVYDEADASVALPLSITATTVDHIILGYKNQPQYTTFRYWKVTVDTAAGTSTCDAFAQGR